VSEAVKSALHAYGVVPAPRVMVPSVYVEPTRDQTQFADAFAAPRSPISTTYEFGALGRSMPSMLLDHDRASSPDNMASVAATADDGQDAISRQPQSNGDFEALVDLPCPKPFAEQLREFQVLGQARNTYIIALTPDGIAVIDQHVAHARVLYERLTQKRFAGGIPVQRLVMPVTLNLGRREALLLAEHCESFATAGWEITPFGGESFLIRAVPAVLAHKPYEAILRDMIEELVSQTVSRRLLVQRDHVTITNACKMAVKAGDPLTIAEMTGLLEQLADTENPYLCPHGRPIVVKITLAELDRQFKRA